MVKDNYKPTNRNTGGGTSNIKYCYKCGKYQHFRRVFKEGNYYDLCSYCKNRRKVNI